MTPEQIAIEKYQKQEEERNDKKIQEEKDFMLENFPNAVHIQDNEFKFGDLVLEVSLDYTDFDKRVVYCEEFKTVGTRYDMYKTFLNEADLGCALLKRQQDKQKAEESLEEPPAAPKLSGWKKFTNSFWKLFD